MLARCPNCRNTFSAQRAGRQDCPICGKPLVVPEAVGAPAPQAAPPDQPEAGTPWERREQLGLVTAWAQTVQAALFEPGKLFREARLDRSGAQLGFAVLTSSVFAAIGQLFSLMLRARSQEFMDRLMQQLGVSEAAKQMLQLQQTMNSPTFFVVNLLLLPLFALVFLYLNAAVTHLCALVFGQNKRGFPATFAACAYACAPLVLLAVPGCGAFIAIVWLVVLTGIGLKETHRISAGGATAAVLAPYLFFCCGTMLLSAAVAMSVKQMVHP